ncbi:MAG: hypothetical protein ABJE80_00035 [Reichenbachiella sp.]|uniref:hypothetical protein n=2 Tax=Reichenbachiella sp. TaxID=2184521 RepID=UPI0032632C25
MRHLHLHRRKVATILLLSFVSQILLPVVVHASGVSASTAGPSAPEATSFEPVDTSDMVNLLTGDFTYNVPLLEIPGPAGSYPMALSYHAGIKVKQEPSWVGLGWNLSPGAINRRVNGIADDLSGEADLHESYWEGGESKVTSVGITIGFAAGPASVGVSAGLQIANDTYKGRGVGGYVGVSVGTQGPATIGVNARIGVTPYGEAYASAGANIGMSTKLGETDLALSTGLGISASTLNGVSAGMYGGISVSKSNPNNPKTGEGTYLGGIGASLLGVSLSTSGGGGQISVGGGSVTSSAAQANKLSTSTNSWSFSIPVYYGVSLSFGETKTRYWIDNKINVRLYGTLNQRNQQNTTDFEGDVYDLFNSDTGLYGEENETIKQSAGSYPDYDVYSVNAQGIGGNFQPYHVQRALRRATKFDEKIYEGYAGIGKYNNAKQGFRFVGDFSNKMKRKNDQPPAIGYKLGEIQWVSNYMQWNRVNNATTDTYDYEEEGYDPYKNKAAGSKHIEYYTNQHLSANPSMITANCIDRTNLPQGQVGGFEVTNKSGLTYHFMLPAYSKNEEIYSENTEMEGDNHYRIKKAKYAYTWFLTAITGPDYVDRGEVGLDKNDFGYWVSFDYSKWKDEDWRNPEVGMNEDLEKGVEYMTKGTTERYYMDRVSTATHTALFAKSQRIFDPKDKAQLDAIYLLDNAQMDRLNGQISSVNLKTGKLKGINPNDIELLDLEALKKFQFDYSGFGYSDLRLKLDRLWSLGIGSADLVPPTIFKYKELGDEMGYGKSGIYNSEAFDLSSMYKSDYSKEYDNENIDRMTSQESAKHVDMWSMNEIISATGQHIKIVYESDSYTSSKLSQYQYPIDDFEEHELPNDNLVTMKIISEDYLGELLEYFNSGADLNLDLLFSVDYKIAGLNFELKTHVPRSYQGKHDGANDYISVIPKINPEGSSSGRASSVEIKDVIVNSDELEQLLKFAEGSNTPGGLNQAQVPQFLKDALSKVMQSPPHWFLPRSIDFISYLKVNFKAGVASLDANHMVADNNKNVGFEKFGGGIRVKEIVSENPITKFRKGTEYDYAHKDLWSYNDTNRKISSGSVLYESGVLAPYSVRDLKEVEDEPKFEFLNAITRNYTKLLKNSRLLPAPTVLYQHVAKKSYVEHLNGSKKYLPTYSAYEFEMFHESMLNHFMGPISEDVHAGRFYGGDHSYHHVKDNHSRVENMLSQIGQLKAIRLHDIKNDNLLSSSTYHYLHDELTPAEDPTDQQKRNYFKNYLQLLGNNYGYQGLVQETFANARVYDYSRSRHRRSSGFLSWESYHKHNYFMVTNVSYWDEYPVVKTGETHTDYRTGTVKRIKNTEFDFYSGDVIATETEDSNGRTIITETEPAYWHYPGMGLKIHNANNKHMLSQQAAQTSYMKIAGVPDRVLASSVTTWGDEFDVIHLDKSEGVNGLVTIADPLHDAEGPKQTTRGIWRKKAGYQYVGDITEETNEFGSSLSAYTPLLPIGPGHDWTNINISLNDSDPWIKQGEITLYDAHSHALEAKNEVSGQYVATKMTSDQVRVISTATNCQYEEMAFSGAEEMSKLGVSQINDVRTTGTVRTSPLYSHSGESYVTAASGETGFEYTFVVPADAGVKKYRAMVWCYLPGPAAEEIGKILLKADLPGTANDAEMTPNVDIKTYGSWHPIELVFEASAGQSVTVKCVNDVESAWAVSFDDFRVQPYLSGMQAYVYDQTTGQLTYSLDNNNLYTQYKYDPMGRLSDVIREINYVVPRFEQSHRYFNKFSENKN